MMVEEYLGKGKNLYVAFIYLSIYQTIISLRRIAKIRQARVYVDIILPSPSLPCLFGGEYMEGVLRSLEASLLSYFTN